MCFDIRKGRVCVIAAVAVLVCLSVVSCKGRKEPVAGGQQGQQGQGGQEAESAIAVGVETVKKGVIEQAITLTGELEALQSVVLSPKISGRLERLMLDDGTAVSENTEVKAGEVVAVLEHKDLDAQMKRARAGVGTAQAGLKQANADLEEKQRDRGRMENLFKEGSVTQKQQELAETAYKVSLAGRESVRAGLAEAKAAEAGAQTVLDEAFIKAPISGVVVRKYIDAGNMVAPGQPIVKVEPMDKLKFLVSVPAHYLGTIETKQTGVKLSVDTYPGRNFETQIEKIYPSVDTQTRTFTMELSVANVRGQDGGYMLRPGMYATGRVVLERREDVVVVPADCLIRQSGRYFVFVVEGGFAKRCEVETGLWSGGEIEIKNGLEAGRQIVTEGQHKLTDNTKVEIAKTAGGQERKSGQ